jgi:hypothetical protein
VSDLNQLTDSELSAVFAVEVAGIKFFTDSLGHRIVHDPYATSMDAVLPYLAKYRCGIDILPCLGIFEVHLHEEDCSFASKSLPRAACCALILATQAEKEAAK